LNTGGIQEFEPDGYGILMPVSPLQAVGGTRSSHRPASLAYRSDAVTDLHRFLRSEFRANEQQGDADDVCGAFTQGSNLNELEN
jgi:hypothetical protein